MTQLLEKCSKEVEVLKEEVKDMLVLDQDDVGGGKSGAEIEELLENMNAMVFSTSSRKRLKSFWRTCFQSMRNIIVMFSMIICSCCHFTFEFLGNMAMTCLPSRHCLYEPLQREIPRVEARHYISVYEKDASRNEKLFRLAKIDFNRLQMLHKEELCQISRDSVWWKDWDLRPHIPYVRDSGVLFLFYSNDIYEAHGIYEELKCFTNAVQRWDMNAIDQLPKYMKPIFEALLNVHDEIYQEMAKKKLNYGV
ncbi:valerianol synthase TPS1A-like [Rhododendron vialii]|uniref:valerianol synthase TPS1A-like n=1 Tax=Rhododendron vialii TaxID=182163 RepID=UPI00265EA7A5|nr:valerianol synthase TPS1A-like [Rhododendron vialii]